jgi:hypothetical protein
MLLGYHREPQTCWMPIDPLIVDRRLMTAVPAITMVAAVTAVTPVPPVIVMTVVPMAPAMPIPSRVSIRSGIAVVVRLTVPVNVAVISPGAAAGHFDNIRDRRGAGFRDGGTGVRRYSGGAQSQRTEQHQNCGTHCRRPSKLHRNNDARSVGISARNQPRRVRQFTDAEIFAQK